MSGPENKSVTEMVKEMSAREEGIQDAKSWRDFWRAKAAEEPMRDEGDLFVPRPRVRVLAVLGVLVAVYVALVTVLVLVGK